MQAIMWCFVFVFEFILIVWSFSIAEPVDIDLKMMEICFFALSLKCSIVDSII